MSLNSVNTNIGAQVALESLNKTVNALQATEKRISTGYRVADATDDGSAYAVAQKIRARRVNGLVQRQQRAGEREGPDLDDVERPQLGLRNSRPTTLKGLLTELSSGSVAGRRAVGVHHAVQLLR